jgi:hypothetical protein
MSNKQEAAGDDSLVKLPPSFLAKAPKLPEYLGAGDSAGLENVESIDIAMPRIGLCQSLSPERKKGDPKFIEGLQEGDFFNTATQKVYGPTIRVIPVKFLKQRIKFYAIDDGGGIDCQSLNGIDGGHYATTCAQCKFKDFVDGDKPSCLEFHNRVSLVLPDGDVAAVSLKSSAMAMSKQWNAVARMRNAPLFSAIYELKSVTKTQNNNTFFTTVQRLVQNVSPDDLKVARALYESISQKTIIVPQTAESDETGFDSKEM